MPGIEEFIKRKKKFKESYEGLKSEPQLITLDGPDGVGKTEISKKIIKKIKKKFEKEGKNPDDVVYLKYTKLMDTESQRNISGSIKKCKDEKTGVWDKNKINRILSLWSAKLNRSYNDYILPLIKEGKIVILDRSEIDLFRACIEWGNEELLNKIIEYMKNGTLTHGITAGNRVFVSSPPEDAYKNLTARQEPLTSNDPRSLEELSVRIGKEKEAEELILKLNEKGEPNIIRIENRRAEGEEEKNTQLEKIADDIVSKLKI